MLHDNNPYHVIKDPVHEIIQFEVNDYQWIKPLIDHPLFQRLRHIKQLGLSDLLFPGAVHTRFNHSLGCCYVASQIARTVGLTGAEKQLVMMASLLHDIGHGPFSHAFEEIFAIRPIKHEDWTPYFFKKLFNDSFIDRYNDANPHFQLTLSHLSAMQNMIAHRNQYPSLLSDIVSSQLDADRLDYLLRDSHFCGVSYGCYDFPWMLHVLCRTNYQGHERLAITTKGVGIVEHYLMARRLMLRNVYYHPKKMAIELYLVKFLKNLSQAIKEHPHFAVYQTTPIGKFLYELHGYNQSNAGKEDFLSRMYDIYASLSDCDIYLLLRNVAAMPIDHDCVLLANKINQRQLPEIITLNPQEFAHAQRYFIDKEIQNIADIRPWQLMLVDIPRRPYIDNEDPILIHDRQEVRLLHDISPIINALSAVSEQVGFICVDQDVDSAQTERILQEIKGGA